MPDVLQSGIYRSIEVNNQGRIWDSLLYILDDCNACCMEANLCRFLYRLFIFVLPLEIQLLRSYSWDPI